VVGKLASRSLEYTYIILSKSYAVLFVIYLHMKISEPIGNPILAPLFVRVALGIYFVLEGRAKLSLNTGLVVPEFIREVRTLTTMPEQISTVYGILLPYLFVIVGALLLIGLWMTLTAGLATLILCSVCYMWGIYASQNPLVFNSNLILLIVAASLLYSGAGALSIDRFRKGG
jgi:uncharacterized membrane protein YphA (DoxX/SURF4 family)